MKKSYTHKEAEYLKKYYADKIIGQVLYDDVAMKVYSMDVLINSKGKYVVECMGEQLRGSNIHALMSLDSLVERLKLKTPEEVLKDLR